MHKVKPKLVSLDWTLVLTGVAYYPCNRCGSSEHLLALSRPSFGFAAGAALVAHSVYS
jgi:hypothetical protein